jgi:hypothetical protein
MKFHFPPTGPRPSMMEEFERDNRIAAHRRMVKSVIKSEVRAHLTEKMAPRLRSLEQQKREAERDFATAQASGDSDEMEWFQGRINQAAGGIAEIESKININGS